MAGLSNQARDLSCEGFTFWRPPLLLCLLPLALTSTKGWIRRLGGKRWQRLHRLIYVAAIAGALHFIWKEKVLTVETVSYFAVTALLIGYRVVDALRGRGSPAKAASAA